jgi:hypothetical protein
VSKLYKWVDGRKTYIFNTACIAYAILAFYNVVPSVSEATAALIVVVGNAITFRSALTKGFTDYTKGE